MKHQAQPPGAACFIASLVSADTSLWSPTPQKHNHWVPHSGLLPRRRSITIGCRIPGFFRADRRRPGESRKTCDSVAVLRGGGERVSAREFPDRRENTGNIGEI